MMIETLKIQVSPFSDDDLNFKNSTYKLQYLGNFFALTWILGHCEILGIVKADK